MAIGVSDHTGAAALPGPETPARGGRFRAMRLPRSPKVLIGLGILAVFVVVAIIGPSIAPYAPNYSPALVKVMVHGQFRELPAAGWARWTSTPGCPAQYACPLLFYPVGPSGSHLLGTAFFGGFQDVWSQLLYSTQATMLVGFLAGAIATALSVLVGVTAGYLGGGPDEGLSLLSNVFLAIPGLPLLIVLAIYIPAVDTSPVVVALIVAVTGWAWGARVLRAQTLSLRNRDFVEAARVSGEGRLRIILFEVLPNLLPIVASSFLFVTLYSIGAYIALAFLSLAGADIWNWGLMLYYANAAGAVESGFWWWWVPPGICIALVGTGLALVNFGIDEFINPRLRMGGLSRKVARRLGIPARPRLGFTTVMPRRKGSASVPKEPG